VLVCSSVLLVGSLVLFRLSPSQAPLVVPVALAFAGAGLTLLSLRARERAERGDLSG
jgi:hypothetical protein